jgi:ribosomal protein S12 methylthiotransferase accessory factor
MNTRTLKFQDLKENNLRRIAHILIDDQVGVLSEVRQVPRFAIDPEFFHFSGKASNTSAFTQEKNFSNSGGASMNPDIAISKSIGEAVERYCSAIFDADTLPLCSYAEAPFRCASPDSFALYSEEQYARDDFRFVPFTKDTPVRWTEMRDLVTGKETFVPAAAVFMPYFYYQGTGDSPILQPISTGLACHASFENAAISAISEVIERDAVMLTWQAMLSMPQIRIETLSDLNYEMVRRLERNGGKVVMLNITMDHGVPTILSVLRGAGSASPALIFAGAADPDPEKAVRKSLEELPHTRRYCSRLMTFSPLFEAAFPDHPNVTDQAEHLHFYCDHRNSPYADFIFRSPQRQVFGDIRSLADPNPKKTLENLVAAVAAGGESVYIKDLTSTDISELGLFVVRAVIPGYQRLCMGHINRCLGGSRLWNLPEQPGVSRISREKGDNPAPHPYP